MNVSPESVAAVVLAGGFGTRIRHLLADLPKPMAPVNGRPFVEWVVRYLRSQGVRDVILSTGYLGAAIETHFRAQPLARLEISCVPETEPLGTAGGFLNAVRAARRKPAAWLVLNGDSLALAPLADLFAALADPAVRGALLGVPMDDAGRYGTVLQDADARLTGFKEKQPGAGTINAGVYLFRAETIAAFPRKTPLSFETDVFPTLVAARSPLKVCVTPAPFLDIGTPESLPLAEAFVRRHAEWFD